MVKYYNCTDKFLWRKGIAPVLFWFSIGFGGYMIVMVLHEPIVNIKNTALTLLWGVLTLVLFILWIKKTNKNNKSVESWTDGYICEWLVKRKLLKLNNDVSVLYDVKIPGIGGNIDFVVMNKYGIFAIEVKRKYISYDHRKQTKKQAINLQKFLSGKGVNINYVEPVLIYALRSEFKQTDNDNLDILGKNNLLNFFNKNIPARKNEKLNSGDIQLVVNILLNLKK